MKKIVALTLLLVLTTQSNAVEEAGSGIDSAEQIVYCISADEMGSEEGGTGILSVEEAGTGIISVDEGGSGMTSVNEGGTGYMCMIEHSFN
ncbi:MAG: hypothetical protein JKX98_00700 [Alcanivoracaceae bacterium]|nr:hypothetical protein [Alcanivoracaceae bacterium]